jgi:transcriptional regulator with XRE-family HTH domain
MQKAIGTREQEILQRLLKECRLEAGLTQRELAARLNTIHTRIGGYERGERRMDLVQLGEYTAALGIPLVRFVERYAGEVAKVRGNTDTEGGEGQPAS